MIADVPRRHNRPPYGAPPYDVPPDDLPPAPPPSPASLHSQDRDPQLQDRGLLADGWPSRVEVMDVPALLRAARHASHLSQAELALAVGTARTAVSAYEKGRTSPTVRTLDRLLAGCGLQARVTLEPLHADLDARVDALLAAAPDLDVERLTEIAASLNDEPGSKQFGIGARPQRRGPVRWAFDGATALGLQGWGVTTSATALVVVLDEGLRFWMRAAQVKGESPRGDVYVAWLDGDLATMRAAFWRECFSLAGWVELRIEEELPATIGVALPGGGVVPVVTVDEVERAHPAHAEVLARYRSRRSLGA